jgi:hypothetical protein
MRKHPTNPGAVGPLLCLPSLCRLFRQKGGRRPAYAIAIPLETPEVPNL